MEEFTAITLTRFLQGWSQKKLPEASRRVNICLQAMASGAIDARRDGRVTVADLRRFDAAFPD
jgi:hypothetical protein